MAATVTHEDVVYEITGAEASVSRWRNVPSIFISKFIYSKGSVYRVTGIAAMAAHSGQQNPVVSVLIANTITSIGAEAFCGCRSLQALAFESGTALTTLGPSAFDDCAIPAFTLPDRVTHIPEYAFHSCPNLLSLTISATSGLVTISRFAFAHSPLESIKLPRQAKLTDNPPASNVFDNCVGADRFISLKVVDFPPNSAFDMIPVRYFSGSLIGAIRIPSRVKAIDAYAFSWCQELFRVDFEDGSDLRRIGKGAFWKCPIEKISFPQSLSSIEQMAFLQTRMLVDVRFHANGGPVTIASDAFQQSDTCIEALRLPPNSTIQGGPQGRAR
jgi:hypothetical protein